MANVDELFPSRWLRAADLNGRPQRMAIQKITTETMRGQNGDEDKPVIWFDGISKGLVLNKTNANTIADILHTRDTARWRGGLVVLYPTSVQVGPEMKDAIRIRAPKAPAPPPEPVDDDEAVLDAEASLAANPL